MTSRDHPRIRGEHTVDVGADRRRCGSSPHTRGARRRAIGELGLGRIIPAYAGSTKSTSTPPETFEDHPRIRGEHIRGVEALLPLDGSSPHTRGARFCRRPCGRWRRDHPRIRGEHDDRQEHVAELGGSSPHTRGARFVETIHSNALGIIPAYAGSTFARRNVSRRDQDHPRIRGEHPAMARILRSASGSSPHTRGARQAGPQHGVRQRIIPAYAGSTRVGSDGVCRVSDHPRIRGEHVTMSLSGSCISGSSPHTRGALGLFLCVAVGHRIIPAYAGSTTKTFSPPRAARDHPRIRGEHMPWGEGEKQHPGSSPHTRGALLGHLEVRVYPGIIPAYAGSTSTSARGSSARADHPRIRGEHRPRVPGVSFHAGSSPHTRGARQARPARPAQVGIIPAYAGSTARLGG